MNQEGKRTILVVDDAPENIAVLTEILRNEYRVAAATNGANALRIARGSSPPDLVLLDVVMPEMSGLEVCRILKSEPKTASIPVIFVTSRDDVPDESAGFAAGAADYIAKPVNPEIIRARVKAHIELKLAREELERQNEILRENVRLRAQVEAINRHDLKSPLIAILNAPTLLASAGDLTPQQRARAQMIQDSGRRMLEMINRTIDLFKMETGTYRCTMVPVDFLRVGRDAVESLSPLVEARGLTVNMTTSGRPVTPRDTLIATAEDLLLYSLLENLLKNAIEASPPKEAVLLSFTTERQATIIDIHNEGAVPEEMREGLFQKMLVQGGTRGSGLGAYSAQLIARTLGGHITYTTSVETGTTIHVRLPGASASMLSADVHDQGC